MVARTPRHTPALIGRTPVHVHLASAATAFAMLLAGTTAPSCQAGDDRPSVAEQSASEGPAAPAARASASCEGGSSRRCSVTLGEHNGVLSCFEGTQRCHDGQWEECANGKSYSRPGVGFRPMAVPRLLSLSNPAPCEANPCDPDCQSFQEEPDEPIVPDQEDSVFDWTEGSLASMPRGLVTKALVEPCGSAYDCQFNYECVHPVTGSECAHSKCAIGVALEPTCEDGNGAKATPSCVAEICASSPSCCATPYAGQCDHDPCATGTGLGDNCHDSCVDAVCAAKPACCSSAVDTSVDPSQPLAAEAESATGNTAQGAHSWAEQHDNSASGDYGMQAGPDNGARVDTGYLTGAPRLDYRFDFPSAGTWYVWIRGYAKHNDEDNSDSLHVGLDAATQASAERITGFTSALGWSRSRMDTTQVASISVASSGEHTVNVWMREDGFWFDKIVLTRSSTYTPSGNGPAENGILHRAGWRQECVDLYEHECGVTCEAAAAWTQDCVDKVKTVCGAECAAPKDASCSHSVCSPGEALDAECHPCATAVCEEDPLCCISGWDQTCVNRVAAACGQDCTVMSMVLPPIEDGTCQPRLPGQTDPSCNGVDLAMGVPCNGALSVCNHGTQVAEGRIRIIHYPGNSPYFGMTAPDQSSSHADMQECFVNGPIQPGHCVNVSDCGALNGNREIMINPPGDGHIAECSSKDNWTLTSESLDACEAPACAETQSAATFKPVHLYFMVDKSLSMNDVNKWPGTVAALKAFFGSASSAGLDVALEFFPLGNSPAAFGDGCGGFWGTECNATACAAPMVSAGLLTTASGTGDTQEQALSAAIDLVTPGGWTPTYPALSGALSWARTGQATNPNDLYAVVFVTDGEPTQCELSTNEIANLALSAYMDAGVRTYTIGMEGANTTTLDTIARAGGTGSSFTVRSGTNVESDLLRALNTISGDVARCQFEITNADAINPADASVVYTPGNGSAPIQLPRVADVSGCGTGWYYDDPSHPTTATLCPQTCSVVQADTAARVDVRIACAAAYTETEITEKYQADCPDGTEPQWGYFAWDCTTDGDSRILLSIRSAPTRGQLNTAEWTSLAEVKTTSGNEQCPLGSTHPGCRVSLYDALGGAPGAQYAHAEVRAVLKPTTDGSAGPSLHDWELTYSCIDAE
jgi:hypothetical protein